MKHRRAAGQAERALHRALHLPRGERGDADRGRGEELAPVGEVAAARPLGPQARMSEHDDRQQRAERAVPDQHRETRDPGRRRSTRRRR